MRRRKKINPKIIISIIIVLIIVLILSYTNLIIKFTKRNKFADNVEKISENNENTIFSIEKIYICSNANVIDNSVDKKLQDLNIYQYSDIAIQIKNTNHTDEKTNQNTVKELYVDNIKLTPSSEIGEKYLYYTNSLDIGKNTDVQNATNSDKIDFNILYTNEEEQQTDYSEPTFYTDCSNPITLKYVNKNIVTGYRMSEDSSISFDGKLLAKANVPVESIGCNIQFKINLVNNNDEYYSCWVDFNIPLNELYSKGKTIKNTKEFSGPQYEFFNHTV